MNENPAVLTGPKVLAVFVAGNAAAEIWVVLVFIIQPQQSLSPEV